jgi:hypothetical protein
VKESGIALVLVLLVTSFLSAVGLGLALIVSMQQRTDANHRDMVAMLHGADAGLDLVARDLASEADWNVVLSGAIQSSFANGAPAGARAIPSGDTINLTLETNRLNCGSVTSCTVAQMEAVSRDRPWGANNPRWQPYAYGAFDRAGMFARPAPFYLVVWVADDRRESDGDPLKDGAGADRRGEGVLRLRSEVFGRSGARHAIEAEVSRVCWIEAAALRCQPGLRVQSWQEVRQLLP